MIPKKIHFCWYGKSEYPSLLLTCMESWKNLLPEYEIIQWNEENTEFDNPWIQRALLEKKYAFISDYVRFRVLHEQGGIYLDTDMLLCKSLDPLLHTKFFMGFEDELHVNMAIVGAEKGHPLLEVILEKYQTLFGAKEFKVITSVITPIISEYFGNLQPNELNEKEGVVLFPSSYFYPIAYDSKLGIGQIGPFIKENTYAAHLWYKSWYDEFSYFSVQEYRKGFGLLFKKLRKDPFQPLSYYKFLAYSLFVNFKKSIRGTDS